MKGSMISEKAGGKTVKTREENVLDLSGKELQNMSGLPKRYSTCDLILDNNSITKIEKLDVFPELSLLSMVGNHLVRMNGINFAKNLKSVNLSNNGIVSMEGLCWLVHLEYLDLSRNKIKRIQNVSYCTNLKHMDLSENSISEISNLKSLVQLEVLLLHGNAITTLERASDRLPDQMTTLSLSGNGISALNEIHNLSCLLNLKHFSIMDNPCVMTTLSLPVYSVRLFTLSCLPSLLMLDGSAVTDSERKEAERLKNDGKNGAFPVDNDGYNSEGGNVKANDSLQSSSYSVLNFSEITRNTSGNFSFDQETDTLRSDSRFLPVLSPMKKSPGNNRQFQTSLSWDTLPPSDAEDISTVSDGLTNHSGDLPMMSEEEANKLINLAATILQSRIRGFLARRKFDYRNFKRMHTAASKIQALWRGYYFRQYSDESLKFRNELRVKRLQKYISTLCLIMQKSEKQHNTERKQMLEIIALLYEKFTQLSEKVKELESSTNTSTKIERSVDGVKESLHPVFFPHPRLSRNVEQKEDVGNTASRNEQQSPVAQGLGCYLDLKNVVSFSKDVEVDDVILGSPRQDIVEEKGTLMDQEDSEWYKKVQEVEVKRVEEDKILDHEDGPYWDKESGKSGHSTDNSEDDGTNEDNYIHKTPDEHELSTDIREDGSENRTISSEMSEAFTTANVCELLKTIESDKELGVDDIATGDMTGSPLKHQMADNEAEVSEEHSLVHQKPKSHHLPPNEGAEHLEVDELVLDSSLDEDDSKTFEEDFERDVLSEESTVENAKDPGNKDDTNEVWCSEANVEGNIIDATGHSEISVVEDTGVKLDEETELSYKEAEEKPTVTPHALTDKGQDDRILKDSLDQTESCSNDDDTIVDITGEPEEVTKNNLAATNVESNNEGRDELQHNEIDVPESDVVEMEDASKKRIEKDAENLKPETVTETACASEETTNSSRLGERASSLLSALKDEITGVTSINAEPDQRTNISTSGKQEITNVDRDDKDLQQT